MQLACCYFWGYFLWLQVACELWEMITGQLGVYCPRLTYVDTLYVILVKLFPVKGFLPHEFLRLRFLSNKSLMRTTITRTFDNHRAFHLLYTAAAQLTLGDIDGNLFTLPIWEPNAAIGVWHNIQKKMWPVYPNWTELFSKSDLKFD